MDGSPHPPPRAETPWRRWRAWLVRWRYLLALLAVLGVFLISSLPNTRPPLFHGLDKLQHLVEYLLLGLILLNLTTQGFQRVSLRALSLAWSVLVLVGALDEGYQYWIPGRAPDRWDLFASASGGLLAVALVLATRLFRPLPLARQRP